MLIARYGYIASFLLLEASPIVLIGQSSIAGGLSFGLFCIVFCVLGKSFLDRTPSYGMLNETFAQFWDKSFEVLDKVKVAKLKPMSTQLTLFTG